MVENFETIPVELRAELGVLRPILERQGVIQGRKERGRHGSYRLRYREFSESVGFTLHRSLSLGRDGDVAVAVAELIRLWQDEFQSRQKTTSPPQPSAPLPDAARKLAQELCGGGWRRRKQIGEWYDQAVNDPAELLRFAFTRRFPAPRKAGRPPKKRLW